MFGKGVFVLFIAEVFVKAVYSYGDFAAFFQCDTHIFKVRKTAEKSKRKDIERKIKREKRKARERKM